MKKPNVVQVFDCHLAIQEIGQCCAGLRWAPSYCSNSPMLSTLQVYDGHLVTDPLIGRYCGLTSPPPIQSSQNYLLIKFTTDSSVAGTGFIATYTSSNTNGAGNHTQPTLIDRNAQGKYCNFHFCKTEK